MRKTLLACTVILAFSTTSASAVTLVIDLEPAATNPVAPQMGDHLSFRTVIRNDTPVAADGVIAWISLVQTDKGQEQPLDLEDWSAHKAVTAAFLAPGQSIRTEWPMRLIQSGHYRVVVSAATRDGKTLASSSFTNFQVRQKPVVESQRVLPIALGIPVLLGAGMVWRRRQERPE